MTVRSGDFVAKYIEGREDEELSEDQIQPNGVDLTVGEILKHVSRGTIEDNDTIMPRREEARKDGAGYYDLEAGSYVVEYGEIIEIPEDHVGFVYPRSRLMRSGGMLFSAVWDSGYRGNGEGGLWIDNPLRVQPDMRIGQMVFFNAEEGSGSYEGQYQGERLDEFTDE